MFAENALEFFDAGFFRFVRLLVFFLEEALAALGEAGEAFAIVFAAFGDVHAVFEGGAAVFVGEEPMELDEETGCGVGIGGEEEGALKDELASGGGEVNSPASEEVEEVFDGRGVVLGELELVGEVKAGTVAVEAALGNGDAVGFEEVFGGFAVGVGAKVFVDGIELVRGEVGEFRQGLERCAFFVHRLEGALA